MSAILSINKSALVTVGLAIVAVMIAAVLLLSSSRADEVELTTADLVPAGAGFYVALNSHLDTGEWLNAFNLIERLGQADPQGELRRSIEDQGEVDWDADIAPLLGGNVAVYLSSFDFDTLQPGGALILRAKDPEAALDALTRNAAVEIESDAYLGQEYFGDSAGAFNAAILDEHLVLALDEQSLFEIIDVSQGTRESLSADPTFRALRDELSRSFLAFLYVDGESILESSLADPAFQSAFDQANLDLVVAPMAAVISASGDAFTFQAASVAEPGVVSPILTPRVSRFAAMVPAEAAFFFSTTGLADAIRETLSASETEINEALALSGYGNVDELFAEAGAELGLNSIDDLIDLFDGETAAALWFANDSEDEAEGLLLTEVLDPLRARAVVEAVISTSYSYARGRRPDARGRGPLHDRFGHIPAHRGRSAQRPRLLRLLRSRGALPARRRRSPTRARRR